MISGGGGGGLMISGGEGGGEGGQKFINLLKYLIVINKRHIYLNDEIFSRSKHTLAQYLWDMMLLKLVWRTSKKPKIS